MKQTALITGATSGIGKAYAVAYAAKGYNLILTGRRQNLLEGLAQDLSTHFKVKVTLCLIDFSNERAFKDFIKFVQTSCPIHVLINNAGYGLESSFTEDSFDRQWDMVNVHVKASVKLAHLISTNLKEQGLTGTIINVCSLASMIPLPSSAMYCSTKSFLVKFSESLALELKPYGIKVQALCPGFVKTDFHYKLGIEQEKCRTKGIVTWMKPEEVVEVSLKALHSNWQVICIPGTWNKVAYQVIKRVPHTWYYRALRAYDTHFSLNN